MRDGAPKPPPQAQDVLVVRANFDPAAMLLPPRGAIFINSLQNKDRCGDALEHVQRERAAFDLSGVLSMLLTDNALTAIKLTAHQDD